MTKIRVQEPSEALVLGNNKTDAYKFSMAQAGFPLREETFYLSFRKGGWQYIPLDLEEYVRSLLPKTAMLVPVPGYPSTPAMLAAMFRALHGDLKIKAVPACTWVYEREPILAVTGPSFVVSWLEPLLLRLFYPIQLATEIMFRGAGDFEPVLLRCACEEQAEIARSVIRKVASVGGDRLLGLITVDPRAYTETVEDAARRLLAIVKDPERIFEVGMRSATCDEQHLLCLKTLRSLGITRTSNLELAHNLEMTPVGTMGHEHVQRWGDDLSAYRAMRDIREEAPTYLLDTFDTINKGIPAAIQAMRESPHEAAIRYDSGDKFGQYIYAHGQFERFGLCPTHIIEDSLDDHATLKFERLREHTGLPPEKQKYGYGGYLVSASWPALTRDRVAAVYKLSETSGEPRMKFGNEDGLGKVSIPGRPVAWRRLRGSGPISIIAQDGEPVPEDYIVLHGNPQATADLRTCNVHPERITSVDYVLSPATQSLVSRFR